MSAHDPCCLRQSAKRVVGVVRVRIGRERAVQPLAAKMQAVLRQLEAGKVAIVFDAENETCSIVVKEMLAGQGDEGRRDGEE
jgi:hypothetical protein